MNSLFTNGGRRFRKIFDRVRARLQKAELAFQHNSDGFAEISRFLGYNYSNFANLDAKELYDVIRVLMCHNTPADGRTSDKQIIANLKQLDSKKFKSLGNIEQNDEAKTRVLEQNDEAKTRVQSFSLIKGELQLLFPSDKTVEHRACLIWRFMVSKRKMTLTPSQVLAVLLVRMETFRQRAREAENVVSQIKQFGKDEKGKQVPSFLSLLETHCKRALQLEQSALERNLFASSTAYDEQKQPESAADESAGVVPSRSRINPQILKDAGYCFPVQMDQEEKARITQVFLNTLYQSEHPLKSLYLKPTGETSSMFKRLPVYRFVLTCGKIMYSFVFTAKDDSAAEEMGKKGFPRGCHVFFDPETKTIAVGGGNPKFTNDDRDDDLSAIMTRFLSGEEKPESTLQVTLSPKVSGANMFAYVLMLNGKMSVVCFAKNSVGSKFDAALVEHLYETGFHHKIAGVIKKHEKLLPELGTPKNSLKIMALIGEGIFTCDREHGNITMFNFFHRFFTGFFTVNGYTERFSAEISSDIAQMLKFTILPNATGRLTYIQFIQLMEELQDARGILSYADYFAIVCKYLPIVANDMQDTLCGEKVMEGIVIMYGKHIVKFKFFPYLVWTMVFRGNIAEALIFPLDFLNRADNEVDKWVSNEAHRKLWKTFIRHIVTNMERYVMEYATVRQMMHPDDLAHGAAFHLYLQTAFAEFPEFGHLVRTGWECVPGSPEHMKHLLHIAPDVVEAAKAFIAEKFVKKKAPEQDAVPVRPHVLPPSLKAPVVDRVMVPQSVPTGAKLSPEDSARFLEIFRDAVSLAKKREASKEPQQAKPKEPKAPKAPPLPKTPPPPLSDLALGEPLKCSNILYIIGVIRAMLSANSYVRKKPVELVPDERSQILIEQAKTEAGANAATKAGSKPPKHNKAGAVAATATAAAAAAADDTDAATATATADAASCD